MQYTINELKHRIFAKVYDVYDIFQNFFGEEYVDLQDIPTDEELVSVIYVYTDIEEIEPSPIEISEEDYTRIVTRFRQHTSAVMVWWSEVTVTNENGRSVKIQDLYAKVRVTTEGRIPYESRGFSLVRTTFPEIQYRSGYQHSHVPRFNDIPTFANPCLGSGPINGTIMDLKNDYEETLWMLFCQELSLYVTVESLRGGPYFRLENIGFSTLLSDYSDYSSTIYSIGQLDARYYNFRHHREEFQRMMSDFIPYYLEHGNLCLGFDMGKYIPGMPCYEYILDISNSFIEFINRTYSDRSRYTEQQARSCIDMLYENSILLGVHVADGKFYSFGNRLQANGNMQEHEGWAILTFKGETKCLHIIPNNMNAEVSTILHFSIAMYVLNRILITINYRYKNEHNRKQISATTSGESSSSYKRVFYI